MYTERIVKVYFNHCSLNVQVFTLDERPEDGKFVFLAEPINPYEKPDPIGIFLWESMACEACAKAAYEDGISGEEWHVTEYLLQEPKL
jgi:hypothetical protein